MRAMIKYDGGDAPRIQHFVKVHDFARMIAIAEGMNEEDLFVLEAAAILHDVGIHVSEARYSNCNGKHQDELGPDKARKVLSGVDGFTAAQTERICWLIDLKSQKRNDLHWNKSFPTILPILQTNFPNGFLFLPDRMIQVNKERITASLNKLDELAETIGLDLEARFPEMKPTGHTHQFRPTIAL